MKRVRREKLWDILNEFAVDVIEQQVHPQFLVALYIKKIHEWKDTLPTQKRRKK